MEYLNADPIWFVIIFFLLLGWGVIELVEKMEKAIKEETKEE